MSVRMPLFSSQTVSAEKSRRPLTVSEITAVVKATLEAQVPPCWVVGEISGYTHHLGSGHRYFTLKDEASQLSAVMFSGFARALHFEPENGMQVMACGTITVYERGGRYQLKVTQLQPAGVGEQALAFERLKTRLEAEGLFAPERKRPLPAFPRTVGVVTSRTGAAIRDIIQVLERRAPGIQVILRPARVQGPGAGDDIAAGIVELNRLPQVDILIVGRGGGSAEDLWPFNEEVVARAIFASERPVISAVGHEIDTTIADFVADRRAPTPSAAAEIVAQEHALLRQRVVEHGQRLQLAMAHRLARCEQRLRDRGPEQLARRLQQLLARYEQRLRDRSPQVLARRLQQHIETRQQRLRDLGPDRLARRIQERLDQLAQRVDEQSRELYRALDGCVREPVEEFRQATGRLAALSPLGQLARGYCVCERPADGLLVRRARDLNPGDRLALRLHQGRVTTVVEETQDD
jgi:exodeoxyribonuclease VII large subunit